jgi:hypothetical protein
MRANIIACGETGRLWDGTGFSIGVNDCWKFGKPTDALVCVNVFLNEPARQKIVSESRPAAGFYSSNTRMWINHPNYIPMLNLKRFEGKYVKGELYYRHTSTFIAITLAVKLGYTEIVLYGHDLTNHKHVKSRILEGEIKSTLELVKHLEKLEIKVYIYKPVGAFKDFLPSISE